VVVKELVRELVELAAPLAVPETVFEVETLVDPVTELLPVTVTDPELEPVTVTEFVTDTVLELLDDGLATAT